MAARIRDSRVAEIPRAHHHLVLDEPAAFSTALGVSALICIGIGFIKSLPLLFVAMLLLGMRDRRSFPIR